MIQRVAIFTNTYARMLEAGIQLPEMTGNVIHSDGYEPVMSDTFVSRFVLVPSDPRTTADWLKESISLWTSLIPGEALMVRTAGWPAAGSNRDRFGKLSTMCFAPSNFDNMVRAVCDDPNSAMWDTELIGNPIWRKALPAFTRYVAFNALDFGCHPMVMGDQEWVVDAMDRVIRHYLDMNITVDSQREALKSELDYLMEYLGPPW